MTTTEIPSYPPDSAWSGLIDLIRRLEQLTGAWQLPDRRLWEEIADASRDLAVRFELASYQERDVARLLLALADLPVAPGVRDDDDET
jgi:hypothetical protein